MSIEAKVDGRRARGDRRRTAIIEATLRVVERDGVAGVTHRVVAREAGVPTTATTYYFATLDDLLVAALTAAAGDYVPAMLHCLEHGADPADVLAEYVTEGRGRAIAEHELYLLAARRPALRPVARRWLDAITALARSTVADELTARVLVATLDGLVVQALIADVPPTADEFRAILRRVAGGRPPAGGE